MPSGLHAAGGNVPNILFVISDDQSYPHASAYGASFVDTPGFDFVAGHGCLFANAFVTSPGSSPSHETSRKKQVGISCCLRHLAMHGVQPAL